MVAAQSNTLVCGGGLWFQPAFHDALTDEDYQKIADILKQNGITRIDTGQAFGLGKSEETLGKIKAIDQGFTIDTKWLGGGIDGKLMATRDKIVDSTQGSLDRLAVPSDKGVDVFCLHSPSLDVPVAETLRGIDEAYRAGAFKRFGISNFSPAQVREVLGVCKEKRYVMPTVYQGCYSAVARKAEDELLPLLRENGIPFFAYSPAAGGFLTKTREFVESHQGRYSPTFFDGAWLKFYGQESYLSILDDWGRIAEQEGVSRTELAYRWVNYHSALKPEFGDGIVFGASTFSQLEGTIESLKKGPLSEQAAKEINGLWDRLKGDAILNLVEATTL